MVLIKQDLKDKIQKSEYIVGTQSSSTSAWTGTSTTINNLKAGQVIYYKLPYASTSTAVTLNLTLADGTTTGAKEVWFWSGGRMTTQYGVDSVVGLVYNGSQWWTINPSNNNTNDYLRVATRIVSGESAQIPTNNIIGGGTDSKYHIVKSGVVLDPKYPILFNTSAIATNSYTDNVYVSHTGVPLTNNVSGLTVTSQKQVYIEGTSYDGRQFKVSDKVFVSEDNLTNGNYYIYIGVSYSTTQIRLNTFHQIVYIKSRDGLVPVGDNTNNPHMLVKSDAGTAGYFKFLTIRTEGTYHDQTIEFDTTHRGNKPKTVVSFNFNTYEKTSGSKQYYTNIQAFYYHGHPTPVYYIQTNDDVKDATFDFYIKRETWDEMGVSDLRSSTNNYNGMTVTWHNEFVTALPTGTTQATLNPYYAQVGHTHGSIANNGQLNSDTTSVNKIAVTDSSNNLKTINQLPYNKISGAPTSMTPTAHNQASSTITEASALGNLGTSANATQATINSKINEKIGTLSSIKAIEVVASKPTASASTMNKLYIVSENSKVNVYYTKQSGNTYTLEKMDEDILDELSIAWSDITGKPSTFTPTAHTNATASNIGQATGSVFGHTKLSDNYTSSAGNASQGIGASSQAVKSVYDIANGKSTVSVKQTKTSGIEIGSVTVNGTETKLYQQDNNTTYTPASATPSTDTKTGKIGTSDKYAREDHAHPRFDFDGMKGTDNTVGYVKCLQLTPTQAYQDTPISIEVYQRDRTEKSIVQIKYNNVNSTDPTLQSITHTGQNIDFYLYKESTSTWSLIASKGHSNKYGYMAVKVDNPNTGITITKLDTHIASLPSNTTNNPLVQSTYIGFTSAEKTKLAGIATGANNYSHPTSYGAKTGVPTGNATLTHGGTFTVTQPVTDAMGHVTALNTRTYTLPTDNNTTYTAESTATNIKMNGTQSAGSLATYARGDHVHPSDTKHSQTNIPANSNLNSYTTPGWYNNNSNNDVKTMTNTPWTEANNVNGSLAFAMEVLYTYGVVQIMYTYNDNNIYFRRSGNPNHTGWTAWKKIYNSGNLTKADITALGIPSQDTNTTYTGSDGITLSGTTFKHTNTGLTPVTTSALKKIKYDAQGHITGTDNVGASDLPSHTHSYLPLSGGTLTGAVSSNSNITTSGTIQGATIKKTNGTNSQLLLADGSTKSTGDFATSGHGHQSYVLKVDSTNETTIGNSYYVAVYLRDINGNPLANKLVTLTVTSAQNGSSSSYDVTTNSSGYVQKQIVADTFGLLNIRASYSNGTYTTIDTTFIDVHGSKKIVDESFYQVFEFKDFYLVMVSDGVTFSSVDTWNTHSGHIIPSPYQPSQTVPLHSGLSTGRACVNSEGNVQVIKSSSGSKTLNYSGRYIVRKY